MKFMLLSCLLIFSLVCEIFADQNVNLTLSRPSRETEPSAEDIEEVKAALARKPKIARPAYSAPKFKTTTKAPKVDATAATTTAATPTRLLAPSGAFPSKTKIVSTNQQSAAQLLATKGSIKGDFIRPSRISPANMGKFMYGGASKGSILSQQQRFEQVKSASFGLKIPPVAKRSSGVSDEPSRIFVQRFSARSQGLQGQVMSLNAKLANNETVKPPRSIRGKSILVCSARAA